MDFHGINFELFFVRECKKKFGKELGVQVWEAINLVFDALPLAACIDDKVIACLKMQQKFHSSKVLSCVCFSS